MRICINTEYWLEHFFNKWKYQISIRGPYFWNEFVNQTEKEIDSTSSFKIAVKHKLLSLYSELFYF